MDKITQIEKLRGFKTIIIFVFYCSLHFATMEHIKKPGLIYILEWTTRLKEPFNFFKMKRESFVNRNCFYKNCFLTENPEYFTDITDFDAILFNAANLDEMDVIPSARTDDQVYIFVSTESAAKYPVYDKFNNFFNWTWTYKLDSDIKFPFIIVRDLKNKVIAPSKSAQWIKDKHMKPPSSYVINKLRNKRFAVAWFVSNCSTNRHTHYVFDLKEHLQKLGLNLDIFGDCGNFNCSADRIDECYAIIETQYYFYLAFEDSFSDDYVTEQLLTPLRHFTVPVVSGGANYSRFLPANAYVNARVLKPEILARKIRNIISHRQKYYNFFRWHHYYTFQASTDKPDVDPLCNLCNMLNDKRRRHSRQTYQYLTQWWNGVKKNTAKLPPVYWYSSHKNYSRNKARFTIFKVTPTAVTEEVPDYDGLTGFLNKVYHYYLKEN